MDSMERYKLELSNSKLLTRSEEVELSKKIGNGCEESLKKFVNSNLRLVFKIANSYRMTGVEFMDLVSEGNVGLCAAVKRFDPNRGTRFSTYGSFWIKQRILKYINNHSKTIRIPTYLYPLLKKVRSAKDSFLETHGHEPTVEYLAKSTGIPEAKIKHILPHCSAPTSIDLPIGEGSETLQDVIVGPNENSFDLLVLSENSDLIKEALCALTDRERYIIEKRFGLDGEKKETLESVGQTLSLTRERIRQLESAALLKMKSFLKKKDVTI